MTTKKRASKEPLRANNHRAEQLNQQPCNPLLRSDPAIPHPHPGALRDALVEFIFQPYSRPTEPTQS
jgi:hypothetical protein